MNQLTMEQRVRVVSALVEGNSIRGTVRMTGVAKNTISKLLIELGLACTAYQDKTLRNLTCSRIQCDEIWSFVGAKAKNVRKEMQDTFGHGDVWTWTAIDADTKLVPCWMVADRGYDSATMFIADLASRLSNRVQLTTDGHKAYLNAVEDAFGMDIDFAQLIKVYGNEGKPGAERYSPAACTGTREVGIEGNPDPRHISTSFVERQNLTMRMSMRRFTRLTNAFSKKVTNHAAAVALHFMHYNFARIHQTLRITPAMAAGVADHVWELEEIVELLDAKPVADVG
jgi:IS1 family transposase